MTKAKNKTVIARVDFNLFKDMKNVSLARVNKGLSRISPKDMGFSEMTRLMRRTDSYWNMIEELKSRPKKEDLKW